MEIIIYNDVGITACLWKRELPTASQYALAGSEASAPTAVPAVLLLSNHASIALIGV